MSQASTVIERVARRHRLALVVVLVLLPAACWVWIVAMARDMYGSMIGASAWMMRMQWEAPYLVLLWAMWAAMMAGMMLPSAVPFVLLYARAARNRCEPADAARRIHALAFGYLAVWAGFSVGATMLQRALARHAILTPMMEPASPGVAAALLLAAGVYQFTPLKHSCLRECRSPLAITTSRWRTGVMGAFRMGAEHGLSCLGCCWVLMLLLFAGGVMNLIVILALTVWVAVEKLAPFGQQSAHVAGALLVSAGVWLLVR